MTDLMCIRRWVALALLLLAWPDVLLSQEAHSPVSVPGAANPGEVVQSDWPDWTFSNPACQACAGSRGTLFLWCEGAEPGGPNLDEPLVSDRPDFTEASVTVGRGVLQLEIGYTYVSDGDSGGSNHSHSYPEMLLRYGIFDDWLEFRLGQNFGHELEGPITNSGAEDLYLGFKIGLMPQHGLLPEMAIVPQMTVPTGHRSLTDDEVLPGINWLYGWDVSERISTAGSTQFNRAVDATTGNLFTEWAQSWTVGYSLSEKVGAYTEWFAFFPAGADTNKPQHYFNSGFTYTVTSDIQWDIRAGVGLNEAADDFFVGSGIVFRFR